MKVLFFVLITLVTLATALPLGFGFKRPKQPGKADGHDPSDAIELAEMGGNSAAGPSERKHTVPVDPEREDARTIRQLLKDTLEAAQQARDLTATRPDLVLEYFKYVQHKLSAI